MILQIYSNKRSNRLDYILNFIFAEVLGIEYVLISSIPEIDHSKALLNYSTDKFKNSFQIVPHSLLFETEIKEQDISIEDNFFFFKTNGQSLEFDVFASSFYMLSRYEEYLSLELDSHGRYRAEESLAFKNNFLDKAVVNRWVLLLKTKLKKQYPELLFKPTKYSYLSTIDIDNAFAFKAKGFIRLWGGFIKALLRNDFSDLKNRFAYVFLAKKDAFDVYDELEDWHQKYKIRTLFFFLVGNNGVYDRNIDINKRAYQTLIEKWSQKVEIGLHPSYNSNSSISILRKELESINNIIKVPVTRSRQHFLKLSFPNTYKSLLKVGVKEDYTMGFASQIGFRAGVCTPFYWFDLEDNIQTKLKIIPFQIMDGTLNDYLKRTPEEAVEIIKKINQEVREVEGLFCTLWHNESLSKMRQWEKWKPVYEKLLQIAK